MSAGPLAGVLVLDVTSVVMGPYATSLLADLGAHVLKIEPPAGDIGRRLGSVRTVSTDGAGAGQGPSSLALRLLRGKRSLALDLADPADRERFAALVRDADAVVTNLRPSARERLGLDDEALRRHNPQIVLCTGQAYSAHSAQADVPGYDDTVQARSGMTDTYRLRDGAPAFAPSVLADKTCGTFMALATVSALLARARGAGGQWVDVPMVDTMAAFNLVEHLGGHAFDPPAGDVGWSRAIDPSRRPHAARDGWVCVMPYTDADWARFLAAARDPDAAGPDLRRLAVRAAHPELAQAVIAGFVAGRTVAEVVAACDEIGVACSELRTLSSLVDDDYLVERGVVARAEHPEVGPYVDVRLPLDFGSTPLAPGAPAPPLGGDAPSGRECPLA